MFPLCLHRKGAIFLLSSGHLLSRSFDFSRLSSSTLFYTSAKYCRALTHFLFLHTLHTLKYTLASLKLRVLRMQRQKQTLCRAFSRLVLVTSTRIVTGRQHLFCILRYLSQLVRHLSGSVESVKRTLADANSKRIRWRPPTSCAFISCPSQSYWINYQILRDDSMSSDLDGHSWITLV